MMEKTIVVGASLDARKAAELVQTASKFNADVYVSIDEKKINAKSIMGTIALNMQEGQTAIVMAEGSDEADAVEAVATFLV